ncbi:MAG: prolyl oligopeptidase family serine peptidase [Nitrospiraceae bacterium]|nr:prolyl oligopeptidase family serine peptidase [Nitrospiraceae bacterium]
MNRVRKIYKRAVSTEDGRIREYRLESQGEIVAGDIDIPETGRGPGVLILPPIGSTKEEMIFLSRAFVNDGFVGLRIDLPGSGESSGALTLDAEKILSLIVHDFLKQPEITSSKVIVIGVSLGAYWMVKTMAINDRIAGGIGISIPVFHQEQWDSLEESFWIRFQQSFRCPNRIKTREMSTKMTLYGVLGRVHNPILAFHGEKDTVNHPESPRILQENSGDSLELIIFPNEGHGCLGEIRSKILPKSLEWSKKIIGSYA